jgi:hypothetical protein
MSGSNVRVVRDVFSFMAAYFVQTCYACVLYTVQKERKSFSLYSVQHTRITSLNKIRRHKTENVYNDTHTGTRNVILAKHGLCLPDDSFM